MMIDKEAITKLVEKYNREKDKRYNEEATKNDFILPLFKILGWDTENSDDVSKEENISGKRVDYGFRIDGIPKFFLEAKGLDENLDGSRMAKGREITYTEQAINYAYYKGCNWAILTNFREIRIYDAWAKSNTASFRFGLHVDTLLDDFDNSLYLLTKEAFGQGLLDKKYGTKSRKRPITEQLLSDFTIFRAILSKDVYGLNKSKNLTEEELDEAIQRLFDRLIFIRNCEDRELEPYELLSTLRQWKENKKGTFMGRIRELFVYFDETYDSKIFDKHLCDQVDMSDDVLNTVISGLYTTEDNSISYDFSLIDADVLGNIYEQYLGHILSKTKERTKLTESKAKRKAEGIYYTPSRIVDYIVRNTVGEMVKNKKIDISKIKVLDPACGSGSFLIKTFDVLNEYYSKKDSYNQNKLDMSGTGTTYSTKLNILKNNIFGVDLDKQAVDIAQLNLLLKVTEKKRRLPILQQNIKNGNSLIDDKHLAGDKAFDWQEEFKDVMENGGFDIIVGNPPYGSTLSNDMKRYMNETYSVSEVKVNTFAIFVEKSIKLLKKDGILGMIIPNSLLTYKEYHKLRRFILKNCKILKICNYGAGVFGDATISTMVLILQKNQCPPKWKVVVTDYLNDYDPTDKTIVPYTILQSAFDEDAMRLINRINEKLSNKISMKTQPLGTISKIFGGGIQTGDDKKYLSKEKLDNRYKLTIKGKDIHRYILTPSRWVLYDKSKLYGSGNEEVFDAKEKIVVMRVTYGLPYRIMGAIDDKQCCTLKGNVTTIILTDNQYNISFILGVLNSKLMNYYYKKTVKNRAITSHDLSILPIKKISLEKQKSLAEVITHLISLNKKLVELENKKTDEAARLKTEIQKLDNEIDQQVYRIYDITEEEMKIIEETFSKS